MCGCWGRSAQAPCVIRSVCEGGVQRQRCHAGTASRAQAVRGQRGPLVGVYGWLVVIQKIWLGFVSERSTVLGYHTPHKLVAGAPAVQSQAARLLRQVGCCRPCMGQWLPGAFPGAWQLACVWCRALGRGRASARARGEKEGV